MDRSHSPDGFYEIRLDSDGNVYLHAEATQPLTATAEGVHRLYPGVDFSQRRGNFSSSVRVRISNILPTMDIEPWNSNWLSIMSLFDRGPSKWHVSIMVYLAGSNGRYSLITSALDEAGRATYMPTVLDKPFLLNAWNSVRVDVDVASDEVYTYLNDQLISKGPYKVATTGLEAAHWGYYGKIDGAAVDNDDITLGGW